MPEKYKVHSFNCFNWMVI